MLIHSIIELSRIVFFWAIILFSFLNILLNIYREISCKSYFSYERNMLESGRFIFRESYSDYGIIQLIFDILNLITNIKEYWLDILILLPILGWILLHTLWIPILYIVYFYLSLIVYILRIAFAYIMGYELIIEYSSKEVKVSILSLISAILFGWPFCFLYYAASAGSRKIKLSNCDIILFSLIFHFPFWYFKSVFLGIIYAYSCLKSDVWKRKSYRCWPYLIRDAIYFGIYKSLMESCTRLFIMIDGRRIIVKNGIRLNPMSNELYDYLRFHVNLRFSGFSRNGVIMFYGYPHQLFYTGGNHGYIMTTSQCVQTSGGNPVYSRLLYNTRYPNGRIFSQRFVYSAFDPAMISEDFFVHSNFFTNNIRSLQDYIGLRMRLNIIYNVQTASHMLVQTRERTMAYLLNNNYSYMNIYCGNIPVNNHFALLKYLNRIEGRLKEFDYMSSELESMSNEELYHEMTNMFGSNFMQGLTNALSGDYQRINREPFI